MSRIDAVVFDMGGVVVELGSLPDILAGSGLSDSEVWERWILSDSVRRFESGGCDPDSFVTDLIAEFGLSLDPSTVYDRFLAFPLGLFAGAQDLVSTASKNATTAVLSNTNELHWTSQRDSEVIGSMFDRYYLSFELGLVKPDSDIYAHVIEDLGLAGDRILFIDDNEVNVEGARAAGLNATVAKGPAQAANALSDFGLA